jgi:hypothetical protein
VGELCLVLINAIEKNNTGRRSGSLGGQRRAHEEYDISGKIIQVQG